MALLRALVGLALAKVVCSQDEYHSYVDVDGSPWLDGSVYFGWTSTNCRLGSGYHFVDGCRHKSAFAVPPDCLFGDTRVCQRLSDTREIPISYTGEVNSHNSRIELLQKVTYAEGAHYGWESSTSFKAFDKHTFPTLDGRTWVLGGAGTTTSRKIHNYEKLILKQNAFKLLKTNYRDFIKKYGTSVVIEYFEGASFIGQTTILPKVPEDREVIANFTVEYPSFATIAEEARKLNLNVTVGSAFTGGSVNMPQANVTENITHGFAQWQESWKSAPVPLKFKLISFIEIPQVRAWLDDKGKNIRQMIESAFHAFNRQQHKDIQLKLFAFSAIQNTAAHWIHGAQASNGPITHICLKNVKSDSKTELAWMHALLWDSSFAVDLEDVLEDVESSQARMVDRLDRCLRDVLGGFLRPVMGDSRFDSAMSSDMCRMFGSWACGGQTSLRETRATNTQRAKITPKEIEGMCTKTPCCRCKSGQSRNESRYVEQRLQTGCRPRRMSKIFGDVHSCFSQHAICHCWYACRNLTWFKEAEADAVRIAGQTDCRDAYQLQSVIYQHQDELCGVGVEIARVFGCGPPPS